MVDWGFLQSLPLAEFEVTDPGFTDLTLIRGKRIHTLSLQNLSALTDLSPLRGMPVRKLSLLGCPVTDISVLAELPLTDLNLGRCEQIEDFSPLKKLDQLERLLLPEHATDIDFLRGHPTLRWLGNQGYALDQLPTVRTFWKRWDARHKAK